jgi:hypothetical protein
MGLIVLKISLPLSLDKVVITNILRYLCKEQSNADPIQQRYFCITLQPRKFIPSSI